MNITNQITRLRGSGGDRLDIATLLKYTLLPLLGGLAWLAVFAQIFDPAPASTFELLDYGLLLVAFVLPGAVGYVIHHLAPEPVDRFHELGVMFSMLAVTNAIISAVFLARTMLIGEAPMLPSGGMLGTGMVLVVLSSLFLPGPYAGLVVARRWSR